MLDWCTSQSLQADGSFKISEIGDLLGNAHMYRALFLHDAGYFDPIKRFWTSEDFPNSEAIRARIRARLEATGLRDRSLHQVYEAVTGK